MSSKLQVVQAYDRKPITDLPADEAAALERKLAAAAKVHGARDAALAPHERIRILQSMANGVDAQRDKFAKLIAQEGGKPWADAQVEAARAVDGLRNAAEELRNFAGREIPMGLTAASGGRWAFTRKEPIGVVAALSAFNHPLNLIVHQIAPAIAVGCPVIIKPAPATPLSCMELVKLAHAAGLPEAWCQTLLTEDNGLAERFATDPRVSFMSFIGSARVGWMLRNKLAPGARCALEHGGAAPVIVDRSAKLADAIASIVKGGYYHAGQVCVSVQRIFVHQDIAQAFTEQLAAKVKQLRTGDPQHESTEVGPLIRPSETTRVSAWIDEAVAGGAKLFGGGRHSDTTLLPAVLASPAADAKVSQMEIFGPVTCVYPYTDLDQAIAQANALPFAFQASVYAQDLTVALHAADRLQAGAVMLNDHTAFRTDWMPFAGHKQSGYGTGGIPYTMRDMTQEKMIVLKH